MRTTNYSLQLSLFFKMCTPLIFGVRNTASGPATITLFNSNSDNLLVYYVRDCSHTILSKFRRKLIISRFSNIFHQHLTPLFVKMIFAWEKIDHATSTRRTENELRQTPRPLQDLTDYNGLASLHTFLPPQLAKVCASLFYCNHTKGYYLFSQKVPSKMFERTLKTSLLIS